MNKIYQEAEENSMMLTPLFYLTAEPKGPIEKHGDMGRKSGPCFMWFAIL